MSGSESEDDIVFITPDSTPKPDQEDQGQSPSLRRSGRKRIAVHMNNNMTKHSASKKKKSVRINLALRSPKPPKPTILQL